MIVGPGINPATTPCPAGFSAIHIINPTGVVTESYNNLQPRIGATYTLDPRTVLRASYGRYVQAPNSAFQQYDTLQADAPYTLYNTYNFQRFGFTSPDHAVRPPVSNNYDFSLEHQFLGDVSVKLTPFLRKTQDQIQQFFLDQRTNFVSGLNVGKQTSEGFELEIDKGDFSRNGLAARLSFTYTNSYINYTRLGNGGSVVDPINAGIQSYNAYTSFCAANPADGRCGANPTNAMCGATQGGGAASACYNAAGAGVPCATPGAIANPYWNAPVQPLVDPNANFGTFSLFPGGQPGSGGYTTYGAPYVLTLVTQYKHGPLAITPALQFSGGQRYGVPLSTWGIAPDQCGAPLPGGTAGDPRYHYGAVGGAPFDATSCNQGIAIPDMFTNRFDGVAGFVSPNQILLHTQVTYDVNKRITLVGNFANIINRCWGGTKVPFGVNHACNYTSTPGGFGIGAGGTEPVGNRFNPGNVIQPILASPYIPTFPGYPFNMYFEARIKL